jgi:hypothetical protein
MAENADHIDERVTPVGAPDGTEKAASDNSEGPKESDRIWNEGFGLHA